MIWLSLLKWEIILFLLNDFAYFISILKFYIVINYLRNFNLVKFKLKNILYKEYFWINFWIL